MSYEQSETELENAQYILNKIKLLLCFANYAWYATESYL